MARRSRAVADHAQGADLPTHWRDHRGGDDEPPGGDRRGPQLGLPLLLAARRIDDTADDALHGVHRRGPRMARVAAAVDRGRPGAAAHHVRPRWRAPSARERAAMAVRLCRIPSRAGGQRRVRAVPARRLRRGARRNAPRPLLRPVPVGRRVVHATRADGRARGQVGRARQGAVEMRGDPQHYVHSKVMAWAGVDRAVQGVERFGLDGPVDRWRELRDRIHEEICERGYDAERGTFTQYYGSAGLDAATLLLPPGGFLPAHDPRIVGTVKTVGAELMDDGFLRRYDNDATGDGFDSEEGCFIACTIWLADALQLIGRTEESRELLERVLDIRNDVGLLAE